ncbi:lysine permease [Conoideocrella luteorostrata]|uniref:Lysine permease n=1 Tax=Conoideocrella luteorostrata TaxID=1105319 RepID=A0AAJ0CZL3_9HYPO|nr:lysine permease [Conoideocrella luteorostrata]
MSADEKTPRASNDNVGEKTHSSDVKAGQSGSVDEKKHNPDVEAGQQGLTRSLQGKHLQFIAIGATFGTGLFIGIGNVLSNAGPASLVLGFIFIGLVVYSVMTALGEMAAYMPVAGAFTVYASRFVDPTLGFAMGWIYWFSWSITYGLELTAAGLIIQLWNESISIGVWIAIFWVIFTAVNFFPVKYFGEMEMWFSMIKVVTVVGFIIFAICVNAGAGSQGYIGFKYWTYPGAFREYLVEGGIGKFVGFWSVLVTAGFSYQGSELVGIGAGETENPRKAIPSAIRWTFWGNFVLFVCTVFFVGINIPYDNADLQSTATNASASPLVIVAKLAGVQVLPDIINAVLLTAVLSAASSDIYSSTRILYALADEGLAPALFKKTNRFGTPYWSVCFCSLLGLLAFLNLSQSGGTVFKWLLNITAVAGFIVWALINVCHLRFMKVLAARGIPRASLPYLAPFQPYLSWFGLFFNVLILFTSGFTVFIKWNTSDFFASYVSILLFVVLYVGHKLVFRTKLVKMEDIDLSMGRTEI